MPSLQLLKEKLFKPVDAITAEVFTRMFGVIILLQVLLNLLVVFYLLLSIHSKLQL